METLNRWLAQMEGKTIRHAIVGDPHVPHTRPEIRDSLLKTLQDFKPHVLGVVGDTCDASALSDHPTDDSHDHDHELREVARFVRDLSESTLSYRTFQYIMEGNHDNRYLRNLPKRLRNMLDWKRHEDVEPALRGWEVRPYIKDQRGVMRIGQVYTWHGWQGNNSNEFMQVLEFMPNVGGQLLGVRGHDHSLQDPMPVQKTQKIRLPFWTANPGTLGPLKPSFASSWHTPHWGAGVLLIEQRILPSYTEKEWDATLVRL